MAINKRYINILI